MNILFIAQAGKTGHSYVTKRFVEALKDEHNIHLLVTQGYKEQDMSLWEDYDYTYVDCSYSSLRGKLDQVQQVLEQNDIDLVFFNEWYDFEFVRWLKDNDYKTLCYVVADAVLDVNLQQYGLYDGLIIAAEHVYETFYSHPKSFFIPWGVDTDLLKPKGKDKVLFQHNAGWGGVEGRKCTLEILKAYDKMRESGLECGLHINTQNRIFSNQAIQIIKKYEREKLDIIWGSIPYEEQYKYGKVYLGVSKYEGLGLYFPEALSCGLPVITTDASPMKQFIEDKKNGLLVDYKEKRPHRVRSSIKYPMYEIDEDDLLEKMTWIYNNQDRIEGMSKTAREYAVENHNLDKFNRKVKKVISKL